MTETDELIDDPILDGIDEIEEEVIPDEEDDAQPPAKAEVTRDDVYAYLEDNQEELQRIARIANAALEDNNRRTNPQQEQAPVQASGPVRRPRVADFEDWDSYEAAMDVYEAHKDSYVSTNLAPARIQTEVDTIAAKFDVPEEVKGDLRDAISLLQPQQLMNLSDAERQFLALAAEGAAARKARSNPAKAAKPHVEAAGSVSGGTWTPAPGNTKSDVEFYCSITGRNPSNKADREFLKQEGMIR